MDFNAIIDNAKRFAGKKRSVNHYDDFLVDRLHHRYTIAALVCFSVAISTYQYAGDPLQCWVPAQFTSNYEFYTNRLCYIQNTYHVAKHQAVPQDSQLRHERTLKYYQWINFILLFQALCFCLPRIIWRSFSAKFGLSLRNLLDAASKFDLFDGDKERVGVIQYISDYLQFYDKFVNPNQNKEKSSFRQFRQRLTFFCQGRTGASLACFYCLIKIFYVFNIFLQITFLQYFLSYHDETFLQYGWNALNSILSGFTLPESRLFPRITLCDFKIRELGERHHYTVECILVINIFIEKMYFLLWLWFWFLLFITIVDLITFIYEIFVPHSRHRFITYHLDLLVRNRITRETKFRFFLHQFSIDNLFALKLISSNSSMIIVSEVLDEILLRKIQTESDV